MKKIKEVLLAGTLAFTTPNALAMNNLKVDKTIVTTQDKTDDLLNIELVLQIDDIYKNKINEINEYLLNYSENKKEELYKMSDLNFFELVSKIYDSDSKLIELRKNPKFDKKSIDIIVEGKNKELEIYFDNIFAAMISKDEAERALFYMKFLSDKYGYKLENFVKQYFSLDYVPDGLVKDNLNKFIAIINNKQKKQDIQNFIDSLNSEDFYEDDYNIFNEDTKKIIDMYILVIKEKLKEIYVK